MNDTIAVEDVDETTPLILAADVQLRELYEAVSAYWHTPNGTTPDVATAYALNVKRVSVALKSTEKLLARLP